MDNDDSSKKNKKQQVTYLFILLGYDSLFSINLNDLYSEEKDEAKLEILFSHLTNKKPGRSSYPLGMGLFVTHGQGGSKLHFFGGENLVDCSSKHIDNIKGDIAGLDELELVNKRPHINGTFKDTLNLAEISTELEVYNHIKDWLNTEVFTFNITPKNWNSNPNPPSKSKAKAKAKQIVYKDKDTPFSPLHPCSYPLFEASCTLNIPFDSIKKNPRLCITREDDNSIRIPNHFGFKFKPVVVTLLDKIYVLSTRPYLKNWSNNTALYGNQTLFEVFDPKKGEWKNLPEPPHRLKESILGCGPLLSTSHVVYKDKLLLQANIGTFLFDPIGEKWKALVNNPYPKILASLEYKEKFVLAFVLLESTPLRRSGYELVIYDLESFAMEHYASSRSYLSILNIEEDKDSIFGYVHGASLSLVENNRICLVCNTNDKLQVYVFDVIYKYYSSSEGVQKLSTIGADVKVKAAFSMPDVLLSGPSYMSTFIFRHDDIKADTSYESNSVYLRGLHHSKGTDHDIFEEFHYYAQMKPNRIFYNFEEHFAFVEFVEIPNVRRINQRIKEAYASLHRQRNIVKVQKATEASESHRLWWRKERLGMQSKESKMEEEIGQLQTLSLK